MLPPLINKSPSQRRHLPFISVVEPVPPKHVHPQGMNEYVREIDRLVDIGAISRAS